MSGGHLISVHKTPCKEIENLIPLEIVQMLECAKGRKEELRALRMIEVKERERGIDIGDAYWLYFDIKRGGSITCMSLAWMRQRRHGP